MKVSWRILGLAAVAALSACEPLDLDLDNGGGGTGGGAFSKGYVFVRGDANGRNLYAVNDVGGDPNSPLRLTQQGGAYEPAVASTGQLVAYAYRSGATSEIRTVPTTGTGQPSVVFSSTGTGCSGCSNFRFPTFSPNGRTIVFTLNRNGYALLARVEADGSGFQVLTSPSSATANFYGAASFYPDGQSVLATASNSSPTQFEFLVKVGVVNGAATVLTRNLGGTAQVVVNRAVVSPDGARVAFDGRTSNGSQIFVGQLGAVGLSSVVQMTSHPGEFGVEDTWPSWRGNTEIVFQSSAGGSDNLYLIGITTVGAGSLKVPSVLEPSYGGA